MPVEITVPQLGESIVEATVGRWLKREGEAVAEGEPLVELETEKVNMEVPSPGAGTLSRIVKPEGETVGIGAVLAVVDEAAQIAAAPPSPSVAETAPAAPTSEAPRAAADGAAAPIAVPAEPSAEPVSATPLARKMASERGIDLRHVTGTGIEGRVTHHDVAAYLSAQANGAGNRATPTTTTAPTITATPPPTAPVAFPPQTPNSRPPAPTPAPTPTPTPIAPPPVSAPSPLPSALSASSAVSSPARPEERVRLSRRRLTIARRLVEAQHTAAMLTTFNEVDMSAILDLRTRRRDAFKQRHGVGLGFMSFFTRAVIGALKAYPRLNAEIQGDEMVLKRYYDIGIAVSTDEGLVVPVLRDAGSLTFAAIEKGVADLAERARNRTLTLDELQGGTFTITNGGVFGSLLSTPILNYPQVGILGMHKIEERPIAKNGQVVIHPMMYLALSYDHRIVDGAEAVSFLVRVKELIEDPEALLLEG
jgi:2-oxoglutarate dehydrogenase E2 component (dihydrolipoamide succinyltransferase)